MNIDSNKNHPNKREAVSLVDIFDDFLFAGDKELDEQHPLKSQEEDFESDESVDSDDDGRLRKRGRSTRNMTEEQKIERR